LIHNCIIYYKAIPLKTSTGPDSSRRLRFPISRQLAQEGGKVVSPTHRAPLPPRKYSCFSFLLEDELTPGPYSSQKDYVNENFQ